MTLTPALDALIGTDWTGLQRPDRVKLLGMLRDLEAQTRPGDGDLAEQRAKLRTGGPMALLELLAGDDLDEPSDLHRYLNAWHLAEADRATGALEACAAARGHGKSTLGVEAAALWHALHGTRRFLVIVSATYAQAVDRLATITSWIEESEELRDLFPLARPAIDDRGSVVAWRDNDLVLANGVRIVARGAGARIRGLKQGTSRPDLLLLDDLESDDSVATPEATAKLYRWLSRSALALGSATRPTSVLWVGSILSRAALLNLATGAALDHGQDRPAWARAWGRAVYPAEVRGSAKVPTTAEVEDEETGAAFTQTVDVGEPLWAGVVSREDLAKLKARDAAAYAAEYLADPAEVGDAMLAPPRTARWANPGAPPQDRVVITDDNRLIPVGLMVRGAALDPQYSTATADPDLAAVVVVGQYLAESFVLDAWIGRDRHGQAARLVGMASAWGCWAARVETNGAQVVTADEAAALSLVPIVAEASTRGKVERALGLAARLGDRERPGSGRVHVLPDAEHGTGKGGTEHGGISGFLSVFPRGRFDDPVDATVMALEMALRGAAAGATPAGASGGIGTGAARERPRS